MRKNGVKMRTCQKKPDAVMKMGWLLTKRKDDKLTSLGRPLLGNQEQFDG